LLRAERQKTTSKLAEIINNAILSGKIVPSDITVQLIQNAMEEEQEKNKFVIDGFPRSIENKNAWDKLLGSSCTVEFVLYLDCPESVMTQRLLQRGQTSGRADDNLEIIKKRFETAQKEEKPVVQIYKDIGKLRVVNADSSADDVYEKFSALFQDL